MSIAPPSDIVLDVAQAADPLKVQAATAKLAAMAAGTGGSSADFASVLNARSTASPVAAQPVKVAAGITQRIETRPSSPYQKFEAMVLQNFMQSMLPKDTELFGDAASADAYRSMLADQLAMQVARNGRLGIAHALEAAAGRTTAATATAHPVSQTTETEPGLLREPKQTTGA